MSGSESVDSVFSSAVDDTAPQDSGAVAQTRPMPDTSLNETMANDPVLNAEDEMTRGNDNTKPISIRAKRFVNETATGKLHYHRRVQCPVCHQSMRRTDLPQHMRKEHGANKVIRCSVCFAVFADNVERRKHMKQNHIRAAIAESLRYDYKRAPKSKKSKGYHSRCPICQKITTHNVICDHLLSAHGISQLSLCDHCDEMFYDEEDLKKHMNLRHAHIQDTTSSCGQNTVLVEVEFSPPRNRPKSTGATRKEKRERLVTRTNLEESWKVGCPKDFKINLPKCEICQDGCEDIDGHLRQFHPYAVQRNRSDLPDGERGQVKHGVCLTVGFECTICSETMPTAADFSVHMDVVHAKDFTLASDDDPNRWPYCIAIKTIVD